MIGPSFLPLNRVSTLPESLLRVDGENVFFGGCYLSNTQLCFITRIGGPHPMSSHRRQSGVWLRTRARKHRWRTSPPYLPLTDNPDHPSRICHISHSGTSFLRKGSRISSWCGVHTLDVRLAERHWPLSRTCLFSPENCRKPDPRSS